MVTNNSDKRFPPWLKTIVLLVLFVALVFLVVKESLVERPEKLYLTQSGTIDMCVGCHKDVQLDPAHDVSLLGCSSCHLGNKLAITEEKAHQGMVLNPGDLEHVEKTCSVSGCHASDGHKVKNSLMATNRGILGTLLYYWGESESQDTDLTVETLLRTGQTSLALDYFRKLCATCHLWKKKNNLEGLPEFFNEKGGGCSACHYHVAGKTDMLSVLVADDSDTDLKEEIKKHPLITKKVRSVHCVRCHNRSGRIGISYMGIFESEGYGTPYEKGGMNTKRLPGNRFYLEVAKDIHHEKEMECIDCHTRDEIMGDGTSYSHYEEQVEIECESCHGDDAKVGITRKGQFLINIEKRNNQNVLIGKIDNRVHQLNKPKDGVCNFSPHSRLSCESCHSTWVAQCYGCHVKRDASKKHLDKLLLEETEGLWEEGRSYIRYERPMLGVWDDKIVIVTPGCQDIVTLIDKDGEEEKVFNRLTMAAINPHTTQAKGRLCNDCHTSTKTVGLGEGRITEKDGKLFFVSTNKGVETLDGKTVGLDQYVDLSGKQLQNSSRKNLKPFNGQELRKILKVGLCSGCHDSYLDPMWKSYKENSVCKRKGI